MTSEAPAKRPLLNLYIDKTAHGIWIDQPRKQNNDWFAIGGILIDQEQEVAAKQRLQAFLANWPQIKSPLHFTDTCAEKKGFA